MQEIGFVPAGRQSLRTARRICLRTVRVAFLPLCNTLYPDYCSLVGRCGARIPALRRHQGKTAAGHGRGGVLRPVRTAH
jgi:hypothetical protein